MGSSPTEWQTQQWPGFQPVGHESTEHERLAESLGTIKKPPCVQHSIGGPGGGDPFAADSSCAVSAAMAGLTVE